MDLRPRKLSYNEKMVNTFVARVGVLSPVLSHFTSLDIAYGKGCYLYDSAGRSYLDFASGLGVASTGHCHPTVVRAIQKQAETLIHACAGVVYYEPNVALAEKLVSKMGLDSVFFTQSGTEAVEAALKLAMYISKKKKLLHFRGGFHGRTLGALSVTTSKEKYREGYALLSETMCLPYPCDFRGVDLEGVAAAIVEPVLGEGGYIPAPASFLKDLRRVCDENGILLIFDEVQSGMGRTGYWAAFQHYGVTPDILCLAKGIASGMPLGACMAGRSLMERWTPGAHGGTYGGNPVTCAAGLATIDVLEDVLPRVRALGQRALSYIKERVSEDVRGLGFMIGIELESAERVKAVREACLDRGLLVISCGVKDNVIRLIPPLVIDEADLMKGVEILISALHAHR